MSLVGLLLIAFFDLSLFALHGHMPHNHMIAPHPASWSAAVTNPIERALKLTPSGYFDSISNLLHIVQSYTLLLHRHSLAL